MKEVIRALQTGALAEVALVAFFAAFLLVVIYTFTLSKKRRDYDKNLPLDDAAPINPTNGTAA